ncbi:hypothetical protein MUO14_11035 [Halobacillus shinanisalinarum]|uniref:Uncharacterized protein n=1 Tax=Halobacillus shinanisalinarum TaxID=2932258 RepID=A0ABY4H4M3_9BACI|nr:CBO0543 family protein [Halobacillus shinanisalinarum]UOQ95413.1 hypothetical protein MUO14_11035 [Halobacillus shinanisalinarum]
MERMVLWGLFLFGIVLLLLSFRKAPIQDITIVFLLTSYIAVILGQIIVKENMITYPINLLSEYFRSSLLYEMLLLPVVCIYFYKTTYHSRYPSIVMQCATYTFTLTIVEVFLEKYTDFVEYYTWTWVHTFIGIFCLLFFIRLVTKVIMTKARFPV